MSSAATVRIWSSQFPANVRRDLLESLRSRQVNNKFHYDSIKQTQKWLELHQAYSPSRIDSDCVAIYDSGFAAVARAAGTAALHVVGLGCGGGQKDTRLLRLLTEQGGNVFYTPSDVSTAMVLVARDTALSAISDSNCFPTVCDLASEEDIRAVFPLKGACVYTFFGMIPNFEPDAILPKLSRLVQPGSLLLLSANLAPGNHYTEGISRVLPQYDNALTRDWLLTFLLDLGVERDDGELRVEVEDGFPELGLKRIVARFRFQRERRFRVDSEEFLFRPDDNIRLFFSYRYTPDLLRRVLVQHGFRIAESWITRSGEEGVFLLDRY